MTDKQDKEVLDVCPFCGREPSIGRVELEKDQQTNGFGQYGYFIHCFPYCDEDGREVQTHLYATIEAARAAWNRRAEAAEWKKNLPSMEGFYFAYCNDQINRVVEVHTNFLVMQCNTGRAMDIGRFIEKYKPLWYKIPTPPLPGKEGM